VASAGKDQASLHGFCEPLGLETDLFLLFSGEVNKVVVFGTDKEWDSGLVESATLPVPLLDRIKGTFARKVEHEEYGDGIIADQGQHVDELALASQIPDGECDFGVPDTDCLLHKVHTLITVSHGTFDGSESPMNVPSVWM